MTAPRRPGEVGAVPAHDPVVIADQEAAPRLSLRALAVWLVATGAAVALDGWTGAVVGVVVLAVLFAGIPRRIIGGIGVLSLAAAPVAVVIQGVPSMDDVSPAFVNDSLWPHHLVFAGLSLVGVWVVLDLLDHLRHAARSPLAFDDVDPLAGLGRAARVALVLVAGVAGLAAIVGVFTR